MRTGDLMLVKDVGEICMLVKTRYVGEKIGMLVKNFHQHPGPKNRLMLVKDVGEICMLVKKSMLVKKFIMLMKGMLAKTKI